MPPIKVAQDIISISEFKAQAAEWLRKAAETGAPVVVTQNGRAAGVFLSPAAFDELSERARLVAAVEAGLADADAGRVHAPKDVARRLRERLAGKSAA